MPKSKLSKREKAKRDKAKKKILRKLHAASIAIAKERAKTNLPDYVNVPEAAKMLGVSPRRVRNFLLKGRLPGIRFARMWMIKKVDVLNFAQVTRPVGKPRFDHK